LEVLGISDPVEMKSKKENEYLTKMYFEETVRINEDGRCELSLPWKGDLPLSSNKEIAMKRLEISTRALHHKKYFEDVKTVTLGEDVPLRGREI
ncbi:hypothetical protein AVEN_213278-1, partial [Araneus ventricosus]